jgi:hypothetical protein
MISVPRSVLAFLIAICTVTPVRAEQAAPVEDRVYRGTVPLGHQEWRLPAGDWRVLAYVPQSSVVSNAILYNVALAQMGDGSTIRAIVTMQAVELGSMQIAGALGQHECSNERPYQSYRHIEDDGTDYECWAIFHTDDRNETGHPIIDAFRSKAAALGLALPRGLGVDVVIRQADRLLRASVRIDEAFILTPGGSKERIQPEELTAQGSTPHPGSKIAVVQMLREWGNRWGELLRQDFLHPPTGETTGTFGLPRFDAPDGDAPYPPRAGMDVGQTFSDSIPIGALRVPLPAGQWQVAVRNPQNLPNGDIGIDRITLVRVAGKRLDGMVVIELRLHDGGSLTNRYCSEGPTLLHETGPDEFCAAFSALHFDGRKDAIWGVAELLRLQGIELPLTVSGNYYGFSNMLSEVRLYVYFAPQHIGLTDTDGDHPPEKAWAPFVPKWQQWILEWGKVVRAGLSTQLGAGPLPEKWSSLDLRSELGQVRARPELGQVYSGTVPLDAHDWPLPVGRWTVVSFVPQTGELGKIADSVILATIEKQRVTGLIQLTTTLPDAIVLDVDHPLQPCQGPEGRFNHIIHAELGVRQDCWTLRINDWSSLMNTWNSMPAADGQLRANGIGVPPRLVIAGFLIADRNRTVYANYGYPPDVLASGGAWENDALTDWAPSRLAQDPLRTRIFTGMYRWSDTWHTKLLSAFYSGSAVQTTQPLR